MEPHNRLRIRLSMEESLLRIRDQFGESTKVTLSLWFRFRRPFMQIEHEGRRYNPLSKTEVYLEDWSGSLLTAVGLGTILGLGLLSFLPEAQQAQLMNGLLEPLYHLWFRLLTVLSGPVVFLLILSTVLNSGGIEEEGGSPKKVLLRYLFLSMVAAAAAIIVTRIAQGSFLKYTGPGGAAGATPDFLSQLYNIVPENAFAPIIDFNTPQLLLLAVVLFVAAPPVPGINLLAYPVLFGELGIPSICLIEAMIFDMIFGIFAAAANQTMLQLDLIMQADGMGLLNKQKLRK